MGIVCAYGHCCAKACCEAIITTVTTTPAPLTCLSFTCPANYRNKGAIECKNNHCCVHDCCEKGSPCTTVGPTVAPVVNPCTTMAVARKFNAKQPAIIQASAENKDAASSGAFGLPLFGVIAMFSFAA